MDSKLTASPCLPLRETRRDSRREAPSFVDSRPVGTSFFYATFLLLVRIVLVAIRTWIDYVAVPLSMYFNAIHLASDGRRSSEGVDITRNVVYGDLRGESMDVLRPSGTNDPRNSILYVHGGGFVSVHRAVLNHSMTPLVRAGFTVFSIDYPLAPEFKHPTAIVSVLKALSYLKTERGVESVHLIGDSAGGCLVSMAVAALSNQDKSWDVRINDFMKQNSFPEVHGVSLLYSICDEDSWSDRDDHSYMNRMIAGILRTCIALYKSSPEERVTIADNFDKVEKFPPTFLLCGNTDLLTYSHEVFEQHLSSIGSEVKSVVTQGFHGYHGLPVPFSFGVWRTTVFPATCELIRWLTGGDEKRVPSLPPRSMAEYDFHLLIFLCLLHLIPFFVIWYTMQTPASSSL